MNELPWYMAIFNPDLLEQMKRKWEEEAKEKNMTLEEYLKARDYNNESEHLD